MIFKQNVIFKYLEKIKIITGNINIASNGKIGTARKRLSDFIKVA